ncbi:hypothetical protein [Streptomyces sp. NRRL B-1347]|uniref:hypothetical protein n=1 Tax=Streptomyces sp. NRRL B-1347 TaxID=1476877 RepID=UPI0004CBDF6D|nr:hypothetical protein [Streptomyces sp. NRRL B-1347]
MKPNPTPEQTAAAALVKLLEAAPGLGAITWTVGQTPGVLNGHLVADTHDGELVDTCAEIIGGTPFRSVMSRGGDRQGVIQLVGTYEGVQIQVWASYPMSAPVGRAQSDQLRKLLADGEAL